MVVRKCARVDVGMTASDSGAGDCAREYRPSPNSAFEGVLPWGKSRRFPPIDLALLARNRISCARSDRWRSTVFCLVSDVVARRSPKYCPFEKGMSLPKGAQLFANMGSGTRTGIPSKGSDKWVAPCVEEESVEGFARASSSRSILVFMLAKKYLYFSDLSNPSQAASFFKKIARK